MSPEREPHPGTHRHPQRSQRRSTQLRVLRPPPGGPGNAGYQRRKVLEPGLLDGLRGGWVAARAASRWVRIWGMTCSVLPIRDCQPHSHPAWRWPRSARAAGRTMTLCPVTCSLTEMVTGQLRSSLMAEPTHLGNRSPNWPQGTRSALRSGRRPSGTAPALHATGPPHALTWGSPFGAFCGWRLLARAPRTLSGVVRTARPPSDAGGPARARRGGLPTRRTQTTAGCRRPDGRTPRRAGWPWRRW